MIRIITVCIASALFMASHVMSANAASMVKVEVVDDGIPKALTEKAGDPLKGKKIAINRKLGNCLACHQLTALKDEPYHGEVGPPLDGIGTRKNEAQLRLMVVNAKKVFEDTIMPAFYAMDSLHRVAKKFSGKTILSAQDVEDVVAFLKTLKEK